MDDLIKVLLGGVIGALITASTNLFIHFRTKKKPSGHAYELLKKMEKLLETTEADYYFTQSADDNYNVCNHIYIHADATIIATAFNEDPSTYGKRDLIRSYRYGSLFFRITSEDVCNVAAQTETRTNMAELLPGSRLVVIPTGKPFTRIDGIFCKFKDNTYLCAMAFRDPNNISKNRGVVFRNGIAKGFYEYYQKLIDEYQK